MRPQVCANFECWWRDGGGFASERPDKIGVFLYFVPSMDWGDIAHVHEAWPHALAGDGFRALESRLGLCTRFLTIGRQFGSPTAKVVLGGPDELTRKYCAEHGLSLPGLVSR